MRLCELSSARRNLRHSLRQVIDLPLQCPDLLLILFELLAQLQQQRFDAIGSLYCGCAEEQRKCNAALHDGAEHGAAPVRHHPLRRAGYTYL